MKDTFILFLLVILSGCASAKHFGDGEYEGTSYDEPEHFSDRFNEFDSNRLVNQTIEAMKKCSDIKEVMMLSAFENKTPEMIDMGLLEREVVDQLSKKGFRIVDKSSRPDIHQEHKYIETGYVDPAKAARIGKQEGVHILIRGTLKAYVQQNEDEKTVRYKLSMQLVNMESSLVKCTKETEIKKRYERTRFAL